MAHGDYLTIEVEEEKPRKNIIPKPDGFVFDNEQSAKYGQLVTMRVKAEKDDDSKLCITEIEGIPTEGYDKDDDGDSMENDYDNDEE